MNKLSEPWEQARNIELVYGHGYPMPEIKPDPKTWMGPLLRSFPVLERKALAVMQLGFDLDEESTQEETEIPTEGIYKCSTGYFKIHNSAESFSAVIDEFIADGRYVALDIETSGLDIYTDRIRAVQVSNDGKFSHVLLCENLGNSCREPLVKLLENCYLVLQNGSFDLSYLMMFCGVFPKKYCFDTIIASQIADAGLFDAQDRAFGLGSLAKRYLGITLDKSAQKNFALAATKPMTMEDLRYAANDTIVTWRLASVLARKVFDNGLSNTLRELEMPCVAIAVHIKVQGIPVSLHKLDVLKATYEPIKADLETKLENLLGISKLDLNDEGEDSFELQLTGTKKKTAKPKKDSSNVNSNPKLLAAFHKLGYEDLTGTSEGAIGSYFLGKTVRKVKDSEREIIKSKCEAAGLLLEWRERAKGLTFIHGLGSNPLPELSDSENKKRYFNPKTNSVHPTLNVCGSFSESNSSDGKAIDTGRMSINSPNLQQIPADQLFRDVFEAPEGWLVIKVDASQQEVRVMAEVSGDQALRDIYINAGSNPVDIYRETASLVLNKPTKDITDYERGVYKAIVLAIGFGAAKKTISASANITEKAADDAIKAYFKKFRKVKEFIDGSETLAKTNGFLQNKFSGRRRHWSHEKLRGYEYKYRTQAANFLIQGGAADCTKKALLLAYERLSHLGCRPMCPVHDELVYLAPMEVAAEAVKILEECMVEGSEYYMKVVPMKAEGASGRSWQKNAGYCYSCNTKPEKRDGFSETYIVPWGNEYLPVCNQCYIARLEKNLYNTEGN